MILPRDRGSEQRHNPVAEGLVHEAIVMMDCIHQTFEDRTKNLEHFLRIELIDQGCRIADIRKNDRDVFALAEHCAAGTQNALGKVSGDVRLQKGKRLRRRLGGAGPLGAHSHRKIWLSVPKGNRSSYSDDLCCRPSHATLCLWQPRSF